MVVTGLLIVVILVLDFMESDIRDRKIAVVGASLGILISAAYFAKVYHRSKQLNEKQQELHKVQSLQEIQNQYGSFSFRISLVTLLALLALKIWNLF